MKKSPGRPKGVKNKITTLARERAEEMGIDPMEILLNFAAGKWKELGYDKPTKTIYVGKEGSPEEEAVISAELRVSAAKEAAKYIYPTQKSVDFTNDGESGGIRVVIEDFSSQKK